MKNEIELVYIMLFNIGQVVVGTILYPSDNQSILSFISAFRLEKLKAWGIYVGTGS